MRKNLLTVLSLLTLLFAAPAVAITNQTLGSHTQAASATNIHTTITNDCPVGSVILLEAAYTNTADTLSSVVDSVGNTWQTPIDNITGTGIGIAFAYAYNTTVDLAIGSTITATFAGSTTTTVLASCIKSAYTGNPLDTHNHSATGTAATSATTVNSGVLQNPIEVVIGGLAGAANTGTVTCGGSYTRLIAAGGATPALTMCSLVVSTTPSNAFSPTWPNANNYVSDIISIQGPLTGSRLMLLGVGS